MPASSPAAKNAKSAPAQSEIKPGIEVAQPKLYSYFRVRRVDGFQWEAVEIQVDESQFKPKRVTKQDVARHVLDSVGEFMYDQAKTEYEQNKHRKK